jgi:tRNA modification GTPase
VRLELHGLPVTLLDMAGLREAEGVVEAEGVALARARADAADLRVFLVERREDILELGVAQRAGDEVALAKADLRVDAVPCAVSGLTGAGVDALLDRIAATLGARTAGAGVLGRERTRAAAGSARQAIAAAQRHLAATAPELASAEIAAAIRALDALVGKVDIETVLDRIFASFCIGK